MSGFSSCPWWQRTYSGDQIRDFVAFLLIGGKRANSGQGRCSDDGDIELSR